MVLLLRAYWVWGSRGTARVLNPKLNIHQPRMLKVHRYVLRHALFCDVHPAQENFSIRHKTGDLHRKGVRLHRRQMNCDILSRSASGVFRAETRGHWAQNVKIIVLHRWLVADTAVAWLNVSLQLLAKFGEAECIQKGYMSPNTC